MVANLPKKAKAKVAKRLRKVSVPKHPLHSQIKALVQPFSVSPGVAQHLIDALPSQKYTVRSRVTGQAGNGGSLLGWISPYAFIDSNVPSGMMISMGTANLESNTAAIYNDATPGTAVTPATSTRYDFMPVRPYAANDNSVRLVSYGLRIRYTGTALNANGTLKVYACPHGELNFNSGNNYTTVISTINGSHTTQMKSVYDKAVYEFNFIGNDEWSMNGTGAEQDTLSPPQTVGQASSVKQMGEPGVVFYYSNNSGSSVQFEIELVENWEVRGPTIVPFYTDSHSAPELHHEIMNTINTAHVRAGLSSEKKFSDVVTSVAKASKSPLGKAVLAAALA